MPATIEEHANAAAAHWLQQIKPQGRMLERDITTKASAETMAHHVHGLLSLLELSLAYAPHDPTIAQLVAGELATVVAGIQRAREAAL